MRSQDSQVALFEPQASRQVFLDDVLGGLRQEPKCLPCKYFYDEAGSRLFEKICELPEYYLTRAELAIMRENSHEIARHLGTGVLLIEYGSGSSIKTRLLLDHLPARTFYVPVDISREHLAATAARLAISYPQVEILPVCADFTEDFELPELSGLPSNNVVYFPGSTVGNFEPDDAVVLLRRVAEVCGSGGGLLIGIDLKKDPRTIEAAYNDSQGVTAEFNLNLLRRINRELQADFRVDRFQHRAVYDARRGRVELGLVIVAREKPPTEKHVYLDHNATTPTAPAVRQTMVEALELFGNPSSLHRPGVIARRLVDEARRKVARLLGCTARRIVFTGGGSEANNLAIKGAALAAPPKRNEVITSAIEHPAVLEACRWLESRGFAVTYLQVDRTGRLEPDCLARAISDRTCLVSIMLANNETGSIQPIRRLAEIAHRHGTLFHSDAVQGVGKIPVDPKQLDVDLLTLSAHKLHGPKGIGALYVGKDVFLEPLVHGGGQESGLRSGTENVLAIAGFGSAADYAAKILARSEETRRLRDHLEREIVQRVPDARLNGHREQRLPNTLNMTLPGLRGESVVLEMNKRGVFFSSGSACHSGSAGPSHALLAMGLSEESVHGAVRFSLGPENTDQEIDYVAETLGEVIAQSRQMVRFVSCK